MHTIHINDKTTSQQIDIVIPKSCDCFQVFHKALYIYVIQIHIKQI